MIAPAFPVQSPGIRLAEKADIPLLRDLAERTWRQCYAAILSPEQMDYMLGRMYAPEVIADEIEGGVFWELAVAKEGLAVAKGELAGADDKAIGFHSCAFDPGDRSLKLNKLYVLPEAQGRGCGQRLLMRVRQLAAALGAQKIWLQVNKNNSAAIRAYERAGYHVERAAVFDIGGGFVMDDFIMALEIQQAVSEPASEANKGAAKAAIPLSAKDAATAGT